MQSEVDAGRLPSTCRRDAFRYAQSSTCGRPGSVACCRVSSSGREQHKIVRDAPACRAPAGGLACASAAESTVTGCDANGCAPVCGNGVVEGDETCDDANSDDTDVCMSTCQPPAALANTVGPFHLKPAPQRPFLALWIVSPGGNLQAELSVDRLGAPGGAGAGMADPYPSESNIAVVRVLDPDERIVHWHYQHQAPGAAMPTMIRSPAEPPPSSASFDAAGNLAGYRFSLARAGVYQVRVATNSLKTAVALRLPAGAGWGWSQQNGAFAWPLCVGNCTSAPATSMWAWIPHHPSARLFLELSPAATGSPLPSLVQDATGVPIPSVERGSARRFVVAPDATSPGEVWRVNLPAVNTPMQFAATGLPLILCDSPATARTIRASVETVGVGARAGTLVFHRFQREILELLPEVLAHAGDDAAVAALDGTAERAVPQGIACAGSESDDSALSPDEVWRHAALLDSWDSPLRTVRWYLARATVGSDGAVTYGAGQPMFESSPVAHWAGAVGLPLLERVECGHDSDCPGGGACGANGACEKAFDPATDRWDVLRGLRWRTRDGVPIYGAYAALGLPSGAPWQMSLAATFVHPCNPWGPAVEGAALPHRELVVRGVAAGLADLMLIGEDDRPVGVRELDPYPGSIGFQFAQSARAFGAAAPLLPAALPENGLGERVRELWTRGIRQFADRWQAAYLVSSMNQSAHYLVGLEQIAHGVADPQVAGLYRGLARAYAARVAKTASVAGWLPESLGPSSSYAGIQHWLMAQYLDLTRSDPEGEDAVLRSALARSYGFFNLATAVEPDGQRTSGFNFSHRIGTGFEEEQYQGARGQAESVPEVATWSDWLFPQSGSALVRRRAALRSLADYFSAPVATIPRNTLHGVADVVLGLDSTARGTILPMPAVAPKSGETVLPAPPAAPEIVAVRRASWFASIWVGRPAPSSFYYGASWATTRKVPLTRSDYVIEDIDPRTESVPIAGMESPHAIDVYQVSPMVGGGLSLFATPDFGSGIVAANWSPLVHHGLVAVRTESGAPARSWEDYASVTTDRAATGAGGDCARAFDALEHVSLPLGLSVYGHVEGDAGLCYARHYHFDDHRLGVRVVLRRTAAAPGPPLERLFENVPFPTCTRDVCDDPTGATGTLNRKSAGATLSALLPTGGEQAEGIVPATQRIELRDRVGRGIDVVLDAKRGVVVQPHGLRHTYYGSELQIGRVEIDLEAPTLVGQTVELAYDIAPRN